MATTLCKNLRLSIELDDVQEGEEIQITLVNDLTLEEVKICYSVGSNTVNRKYHRKEALIIGLRQLIDQAVKEGLISVCRGVSWDLSSMLGSSSPTTSSTELGV